MVTYDSLLQKYEQIIQENFKVKNPYLLKTGTLGTLINIFANQELDVFNYYNKLFQETHPSLAQDFNSMLFHSNFYGVDINFSKPATFSVYFTVPQINTQDAYYYEYIIQENTNFYDSNGYKFIIPDKITIFQDSGKVKAYAYTKDQGKRELNIIESAVGNSVVYLVEYNNIQQYSRNFYSNIVTDYNIGNSFYFDIPVDNYQKIYQMKSWVNLGDIIPDIEKFKNYYQNDIAQVFNLQPLNIKYFDYSSGKFDYDIFVDIKETLLSFRTGNGIRGIKLPTGAQIITEIDITEGEKANTLNIKTIINNVLVKKVTLDKQESFFKTNMEIFSVTGGEGGQGFENIESIRQKIFSQIQVRNSLLTEADYENAFSINNIKPFVDAKFLNNNPIIFIFNPLKYKNKTIETLATNISEIDIASDPFYPEWTPNPENGKKFISPFYFKRKNENIVDAYIVIPEINVPLYTTQVFDLVTLTDNKVDLYIEYDFTTRKSYLKLKNTKDEYTYKLTCNYFGHTFTFGENFTWEVDSVYTDKYCIIKEPLKDFELSIYNEKGEFVMSWYNKDTGAQFFQLKKKQEIYKYYKPQENNYTLDEVQTTVAEEYLDNQLEEILSDIEKIYHPIEYNELPTLLRVPFLDKDLFDSIPYSDFFNVLDLYFQIDEHKDKIPLTTRIQQTFYNTYDYESNLFTDYKTYIFKESSNDIMSPKIPIVLNITLDSEIFKVSNFESTFDFEFDLKILLTNLLLEKEGFNVEFFESEIENKIILNYMNTDYNKSIVKNIEMISPKKFIVDDAETIYYNIKEKMGFDYLMNFVPPYFYYDYDNIQITISMI